MPRKSPSYDPALKTLVEFAPADWLPLLGMRLCWVTLMDSDIATVVSGAADKVLHVHADPDYLLLMEFQAGHDSAVLPPRLRLYNTVLDYRHDLPVLSVAVLFGPGGDSPRVNGLYTRTMPGRDDPYGIFRYEVIRIWELPVEPLLTGGLGTLPLAPICNVSQGDLPEIVRRMHERLDPERGRRKIRDLWTAAHVLTGLRYSPEIAESLFRSVVEMKESSTYQAIVAEGALEEARKLLVRIGTKCLGAPDSATRGILNGIVKVNRLEQLAERVVEVDTWAKLLATPMPRRRIGRR
jgi:predicted transposase YdaD